ncbi:hypothetical protein BDV26DRAFT_287962 [Aspergillus bertholletiae]|uniref:Uncharacterized protein n=1 Tax=Aspergillus bertholletiae TaxID=1226010 RepID=A0A5N7BMF1_9EURO|nr:hypothetical protein BDV26DRAFT_287962 [Aspergillus bertholletiae]
MTELVMDARRDQSKERIGYAIHAHCWVLVDRVIGQDIVQKHLRKFTLAAQAYWVRNSDDWRAMPDHPIHDVLCYGPQEIDWHMVLFYPRSLGSPLRMQGMRKLIAQATRGDPRVNLRGNSVILDLPLDIAILVIDLIFKRPRCRERLSDINSLLEALQWKLPDTYWKARCEYWFLFEIDDLIKENRAVNWKRLCLAMEELLLDKIWYCNSGLKARQQALMSLEGIKEYFLGMIDSST